MKLLNHRFAPIFALLALCAIAFGANLGQYGIVDLDEGLYAQAAREMVITGDWVTPHVNGAPFFEKPPLAYWAAGLSMKAFGQTETAVRLPSALAMTFLTLLIFFAGQRLYSRRVGLLAAAALALSPIPVGAARLLTMDALLALWTTASLASWWMVRHTAIGKSNLGWMALFGGFMGLGVLTKGLPGIVLPLFTAAVHEWLLRRAKLKAARPVALTSCAVLVGSLALVAFPWHVLAYRASGPAFTQEYIVRQHISRFKGGDTSHREPFWFFVPALAVGFFPWSLVLPSAFRRTSEKAEEVPVTKTRSRSKKNEPLPSPVQDNRSSHWFLAAIAGVTFLLFSASGSKLISYILPMYPACALLVAVWLDRTMSANTLSKPLVCATAIAAIIAVTLAVVSWNLNAVGAWYEQVAHRSARIDELPRELVRFMQHLFTLAALLSLTAFVCSALRRNRAAVGMLVATAGSMIGITAVEGVGAVNSFSSDLHKIARRAGEEMRLGAPVILYTGSPRRPSVLFYLPADRFKVRPSEGTSIRETTEPKDISWFLVRNRPGIIITDVRRAGELMDIDPAIVPVKRFGNWAMVKAFSQRPMTVEPNPVEMKQYLREQQQKGPDIVPAPVQLKPGSP